jgi:rubrerythrin
MIDYNLLSPTEMDDLLFSPFQQALGSDTWQRMQTQLKFYQYYDGKQHIDPRTGQLVRAVDLPRPDGLDYTPTRYATNYFKTFIQRKSRWQMGGQHNVVVKPKQIDDPVDMANPDYEPSTAQKKEDKRADGYQKLLQKIWKETKMREKLLQASRDRLIAGNVGCKIAFNPRTGRIEWFFRPDTEIVPVYSNDDFNDLLAVHFITFRTDDKGNELIRKQTFSLDDADGLCYLEDAEYDETLKVVNVITARESMDIDFIPVVLFPIADISGRAGINNEAEDMKEQTDILNQLNEDAIDSLKFEMFGITAFLNVPAGTADKVRIAPGSVLEATASGEGKTPDIKRIEGTFGWKDAYQDTYARVKGALHEITGVPNIVPQELNFGGLNGDALQILFHTIIQETEEHWLVWQERLQELHEKTVRYLQARTDRPKFAYDKAVLREIGDDYENEIKFALPLPENRAELVELLTLETTSGFESTAGAMQRLGVQNVKAKKQEIDEEKQTAIALTDPYAGATGVQQQGNTNTAQGAQNSATGKDKSTAGATTV